MVVKSRVGARRRPLAVLLVISALLLVALAPPPAQADVTAVKGSALGYSCAVTIFGTGCTTTPASPTVTLASNASNSPQTAMATSGRATAGPGGPAIIFTSGQINVGTQGTLGVGGSVTSSTNIASVNSSGQEPFTASNLQSSCTASESGASGSTTITSGTLQTDSGLDLNGDGDYTDSGEHAPVDVTLPTNPAPNTSIDGHIHIGDTTDTFTYVFNEQIVNPDGSITVNAAHEYLHGPTAVGELIIGQAVCGVTATADTTPPQTTIDTGPSGTINTGSASFTFSSEAGASFECKLDGPGGATGTFGSCTSPKSYTGLADGTYTFWVRATDAAGNTDQSPDTRSFTVATPVTVADLSLELSDSPDPVAARDQLTYTVRVANAGPDTASGVTVFTDTAKGTKFISATGANCTTVKGKNSGVSCDLDPIASGASAEFTIVIKVGGRPLTATSTVSSDARDDSPANNTDTEDTAIAP